MGQIQNSRSNLSSKESTAKKLLIINGQLKPQLETMANSMPSTIKEEEPMTNGKLRVRKRQKRTPQTSAQLDKAVMNAKNKQSEAKAKGKKFFNDLYEKTGINMEDTLKNLNQMSKAILNQPELM